MIIRRCFLKITQAGEPCTDSGRISVSKRCRCQHRPTLSCVLADIQTSAAADSWQILQQWLAPWFPETIRLIVVYVSRHCTVVAKYRRRRQGKKRRSFTFCSTRDRRHNNTCYRNHQRLRGDFEHLLLPSAICDLQPQDLPLYFISAFRFNVPVIYLWTHTLRLLEEFDQL